MKIRWFLSILVLSVGIEGCYSQRIYQEEYSQYKVYTDLQKALENKDEVKVLV